MSSRSSARQPTKLQTAKNFFRYEIIITTRLAKYFLGKLSIKRLFVLTTKYKQSIKCRTRNDVVVDTGRRFIDFPVSFLFYKKAAK